MKKSADNNYYYSNIALYIVQPADRKKLKKEEVHVERDYD